MKSVNICKALYSESTVILSTEQAVTPGIIMVPVYQFPE